MKSNRRRIIRTILIVSAVLLCLFVLDWHYSLRTRLIQADDYYREIPGDAVFVSSSDSNTFELSAEVSVSDPDSSPSGYWEVSYIVNVRNISGQSIRNLMVTIPVPAGLKEWVHSPFILFGTLEEIDLIPGEIPLGLSAATTKVIPDSLSLTSDEQAELFRVIRGRIRVGLFWDDNAEFLIVDPEHITYEGFPDGKD